MVQSNVHQRKKYLGHQAPQGRAAVLGFQQRPHPKGGKIRP